MEALCSFYFLFNIESIFSIKYHYFLFHFMYLFHRISKLVLVSLYYIYTVFESEFVANKFIVTTRANFYFTYTNVTYLGLCLSKLNFMVMIFIFLNDLLKV